jgi:hypothetical protein
MTLPVVATGREGKARASEHASEGLPWTRKGGGAPFDPINGRVVRRGQPGPLNQRGCSLLTTRPIPGFQGPSALGGVEGRSPRLAYPVPAATADRVLG